jgi:aryl-alcohol dehydrogenase-like predicted oxidoreductase
MSSRLTIGTVQFGLDYGVANKSGQVSRKDAKSIISLARLSGIDALDTAISYGESETCLGAIGLGGFKVITKLPPIPGNITDVATWVYDQMEESLYRLNLTSVYGLLLHHSQQLLGSKGKDLSRAIQQLKIRGKVQKIGVSIYAPSELDRLMGVCKIDIVQAPFNLIDQRLEKSGWLQKLYNSGVEVHVRSVFLQGLLLMTTSEVPEKFKYWQPLLNTFHNWLIDNNISALQACIGFVHAHPQIAKIVVGVDSKEQLKQLIQVEKLPKNIIWPNINCSDENLINPSSWDIL